VKKYDLELLKLDLGLSIQSFCLHLFPNGKYSNRMYCVGSLSGEPGNSLKICLFGEKVGMWKDFATGEGGNNLLDLLHRARGGSFTEACAEAANWLNDPDRYEKIRCSLVRREYGHTLDPKRKKMEDEILHDFSDLQPGTKCDLMTLARAFGVSVDGLLLAESDGSLKFFDHPVNGRCWSVVDGNNRVRQDRRMDGQLFQLKEDRSAKARTIGSPSWPVGMPTDKQVIAIVEGSSDFLAAYSLICAEGVEEYIRPAAMLGAANYIHVGALEYFRGKYVLAFPDYDLAGISGATRWHRQLDGIVAGFKMFNYKELLRDDGQPVKDLRDFLRVDVDQWEMDADVRSPLGNFVSKLLAEGKIHVAHNTN
jgi:hypothetical protein